MVRVLLYLFFLMVRPGPVEYILKRAVKGTYEIGVRLFSPVSVHCALGAILVKVNIWTRYGASDANHEMVVVPLQPSDTTYHKIASVVF